MATPSPLSRAWRILILICLSLVVGLSGITAARKRAAAPAADPTPAPQPAPQPAPKPIPAKPAAAEPATPPPSPEPQQARSPATVTPLTAAQNSATNVVTSFTRGQDYLRERDAWFYGQRAYPNTHIPTGARLAAIQQLDGMMQSQNQSSGPSLSGAAFPFPGNTNAWKFIGPAPLNSVNTGGTTS